MDIMPERGSRTKIQVVDNKDIITPDTGKGEEYMSAWRVDSSMGEGLKLDHNLSNANQSLAKAFAARKREIVNRHQDKKESAKTEVQNAKAPRTKEEILKQRKVFMEYKRPKKNGQDYEEGQIVPKSIQNQLMNSNINQTGLRKEPDSILLERLATGTRTKVDTFLLELVFIRIGV